MMEIGEILREAREAEGITLDNLQETTKIQKRYLMAIEQGNFHILPGKFYARAFIKEYALAVGLNPTELLNEFGENVPQAEAKQTEQYTRMQRSRRADNASKSPAILSIIPAIIVALLVIGIIFVAVTLYQKSKSDTNHDPTNNQGQNEVIRNPSDGNKDSNNNEPTNEDESNVNNNEESAHTDENGESESEVNENVLTLIETGTGQKPESIFELTHTGDTLTLQFEPTGESWLDIINEDSETIFQGMTKENEPIELDVSEHNKVRLNIGYAPSLPKIMINDIELEYPVDANKFVNQRIWIEINKETE